MIRTGSRSRTDWNRSAEMIQEALPNVEVGFIHLLQQQRLLQGDVVFTPGKWCAELRLWVPHVNNRRALGFVRKLRESPTSCYLVPNEPELLAMGTLVGKLESMLPQELSIEATVREGGVMVYRLRPRTLPKLSYAQVQHASSTAQ